MDLVFNSAHMLPRIVPLPGGELAIGFETTCTLSMEKGLMLPSQIIVRVFMQSKKRVFVVGGNGFLGYYIVQEFLNNGWEATALGLPPIPPANVFPAAAKIILCDLEALVYAAGMDDRYTPKKPAYPKFYHANVEVPLRVLRLAKQAGVKHAMVFGSYFSHFHRIWPGMKLAEHHPYIRSRVEQERAVTSLAGLDVDVLELPYIFGNPLWRNSLWPPLVKYIRYTPLVFFMHGGTACIAAKTVGNAAFKAIEQGHKSTCYPIGEEYLTWTQMLTRLARADGRKLRVVHLPSWVIHLGMLGIFFLHNLQGKESGLNLVYFTQLQTAETYIDPKPSQDALGFQMGDLDEAFKGTVEA
jgi:nucleoside-diphosphate-sugar epimerase